MRTLWVREEGYRKPELAYLLGLLTQHIKTSHRLDRSRKLPDVRCQMSDVGYRELTRFLSGRSGWPKTVGINGRSRNEASGQRRRFVQIEQFRNSSILTFVNVFLMYLPQFWKKLIDDSMVLAELIQKKAALNQEQLSTVISCFKPVKVKKNEHLLKSGAIADKLFFINKGCLRLYYSIEDHNIATRFMAFEHTFLTSIVSFISREPTSEFIQAVEASELLVISYQDFFHLREQIPAWDKIYIYILEYGLTVITSKLSSLLTQNATERYRNLLKNNPELVQRLSNANLAAYLNISPETLSRLKSHM